MSDVFYAVGERAHYIEAGKAMRQGQRRMVALTDPVASEADWRTFAAVCCLTVAYSKLDDHVMQADIVKYSGLSTRQVRRSLRRLAERGVIAFRPGRGAGVLSVVGLAPEGMKAAEWQAALGLPPVSAFSPPKGDKPGSRKSGHPRVRAATEEPRSKDPGLEQPMDLNGSLPPRKTQARTRESEPDEEEHLDRLWSETAPTRGYRWEPNS